MFFVCKIPSFEFLPFSAHLGRNLVQSVPLLVTANCFDIYADICNLGPEKQY